MRKGIYLQSFGCQMNERDSEELIGILIAQGYEVCRRPEEADVILFNTCSVRQHAEERAFGKMGELSVLKQERPELILGIIGCMAKIQQAEIFKRLPRVDLVAGPAELYDMPNLLARLQERQQLRGEGDGTRLMAVGRNFRPLDEKPAGEYRKDKDKVRAFVTIMEGCDKACTYCVVPKTRGQEISRPADEILAEIARLAEAGYQEITLLGQNVNSYGKRFPDGSGYRGPLGRLRMLEGNSDELLDFPKLIRLIDRQASVPRIRFTTSHPFDANRRLFEAMRDCETLCEWLHLPVQSGANRVLRAMRRGYTYEGYLKRVEKLKRLVPGVGLSTDIIVGFPGETDEEFDATVRLMKTVEYDDTYVFKYSPRPGTAAAARKDDIPQKLKDERNQRLLALRDEISQRKHQALVGSAPKILVERRGHYERQWFGRTRANHGVIVESPDDLLGFTVQVQITRGTEHTLFGQLACSASSHS